MTLLRPRHFLPRRQQPRARAVRSGWLATGSLQSARLAHSATLLQDGRVLVAGGRGERNTLQSAEIYDPQTGEWTPAAAMLEPRTSHTATRLPDGSVLVAGGVGSGRISSGVDLPLAAAPILRSVERYIPSTDSWVAAAALSVPRAQHAALALADGRVLVSGGVGFVGDAEGLPTSLAVIEWYSPVADEWAFANRGHPRHSATATLLASGDVLLLGGLDSSGGSEGPATQADLISLSAARTDQTIPQSIPRAAHTATLLANGSVLLAGGMTRTSTGDLSEGTGAFLYENTEVDERYLPDARSLEPVATLPQRRHGHTATLLSDGSVLMAGGAAGVPPFRAGERELAPSRALASSARYLPAAGALAAEAEPDAVGAWLDGGDLLLARTQHTATLLDDGRVLVCGGATFQPGAALNSAELFSVELLRAGGCNPILLVSAALAGAAAVGATAVVQRSGLGGRLSQEYRRRRG